MPNSFLFSDHYRINDYIDIRIPTVGEMMDNEEKYFEVVCSIIATPYDMMVQLDDCGIDFTQITAFELFCMMFRNLQEMDVSLVLGDINLADYHTAVNEQNGQYVLYNEKTGDVIDVLIHEQMCSFLRKMLHMPKTDKKPGNKEAKRYLLERARLKQKRQKRKKHESQLEKLVVALVNTSEFPYNYQTVRDVTIYQFYESLDQISRKIRFDNTMIGCYAGTIKYSELGKDEKSWISIE